MLQKLNERIQGVVAWVVVSLIALTFALFGANYYMQSHTDTSTQVEVNGQPISKQEYELNFRRTRQLNEASLTTAQAEIELKKQVLNDMILNKVSVQAARAYGFEVSPVQANNAIVTIPQFQEDGQFSADRYQQALTNAFFTADSFQNEVRQGMLLNQQRFAFMGTAFALPDEINRYVKLSMQTRDYEYLIIDPNKFKSSMTVSDDEIAAYYQKNKTSFTTPETVSIEYVRLSVQDILAKSKITDDEIKHYYDENQSNYLTPAEWKVAHILFAIPADASEAKQLEIKSKAEQTYQVVSKNPALFDEEVVKHSDDKISALTKGVLPWIVAGQSELDATLVNLTTPGQISEPVKTQHGYELYKILAYKKAAIKPLNEVATAIKQQLLAERSQTDYARALEQLSDLSYQSPDSLAPAADALKLKVEQTTPFSRLGGSDEISKNPLVINAAFSQDVLELGNNSDPVQVDNDTVVILRLKERLPAAQKPLSEVKALIADKLQAEKTALKAKALGNELLKAKDDSTAEGKLIAENHLIWQAVNKATRETDKEAAINEMAFDLSKPLATTGLSLPNGDFVIVKLKKINEGNISTLDKEQIASITQQLEANFGMMDYDLYVSSLMSSAKINKP